MKRNSALNLSPGSCCVTVEVMLIGGSYPHLSAVPYTIGAVSCDHYSLVARWLQERAPGTEGRDRSGVACKACCGGSRCACSGGSSRKRAGASFGRTRQNTALCLAFWRCKMLGARDVWGGRRTRGREVAIGSPAAGVGRERVETRNRGVTQARAAPGEAFFGGLLSRAGLPAV